MKKFLTDESGQGMVEYGLILGVIAVAAIGVLLLLGPRIKNIFQSADDDIQKVPGADRPEN